jgi:hypothetical protein
VNALNKKQQEVFDEIIETEEGYNTDIQAIVAVMKG